MIHFNDILLSGATSEEVSLLFSPIYISDHNSICQWLLPIGRRDFGRVKGTDSAFWVSFSSSDDAGDLLPPETFGVLEDLSSWYDFFAEVCLVFFVDVLLLLESLSSDCWALDFYRSIQLSIQHMQVHTLFFFSAGAGIGCSSCCTESSEVAFDKSVKHKNRQ